MKKRYVGLFIAPKMCDGIYDKINDPNYDNPLDSDKIIEIMNDTNNEIRVWKQKYDEIKNENKILKERIKYLENNKV